MNWYRALENGSNPKRNIVCDINNLNEYGLSEANFQTGKEIITWPENIVFTVKNKSFDGNVADDALRHGTSLAIFSHRLMICFDENNIQGIQWLPIQVKNHDGINLGKFYIVNILNLINALDMQKSTNLGFPLALVNELAGRMPMVSEYVIKSQMVESLDIFRLESYARNLFVSEKIKKIFTKNKFSGFSFQKVGLSNCSDEGV